MNVWVLSYPLLYRQFEKSIKCVNIGELGKIDIFDRIYTHVCAPSSSKEQYMFSLQGWFHIGGAGIIVGLYGINQHIWLVYSL